MAWSTSATSTIAFTSARFMPSATCPISFISQRCCASSCSSWKSLWRASFLLSGVRAFNKLIALDTYVTSDQIAQFAKRRVIESGKAMLAMSTPVTSIWDGVLLLPLVGIVDSQRTQDIMEKTLTRIAESRARVFVMDISGVVTVDTAVANNFIRITQATRLMGCDCIISGISPSVARTLVELGANVGEVRTTATLRDALQLALATIEPTARDGKVAARSHAEAARR